MNFQILIAFILLTSSSTINALEFDYCVADPTLPHDSLSYTCKDPTKYTVDDFSYSGLRVPGNTSNIFKFGLAYGSVSEFPALNGMGVSMVRADTEVGGVAPFHSHRVTELIIVIEGTVTVGFIDTNNKPFFKTLEKGDMFVMPPTLLHFVVNVGNTKALIYGAYNSPNPGVQGVSLSLFTNNLPTDIIQKTTLLDAAQILKLKVAFGGTN